MIHFNKRIYILNKDKILWWRINQIDGYLCRDVENIKNIKGSIELPKYTGGIKSWDVNSVSIDIETYDTLYTMKHWGRDDAEDSNGVWEEYQYENE